jgi:hypothetical protein
MNRISSYYPTVLFALLLLALAHETALAQRDPPPVILSGAQLARVVPPGFYFEGQSAPTQMRNSAAARYGARRHIIAGMVDTSGYSSDVRSRYEGFFIVDTPVVVGGRELPVGAYGFGFVENNKFSISDVGGNLIFNIETEPDRALRRPRPLMMTADRGSVRLYSGRRYVVISPR